MTLSFANAAALGLIALVGLPILAHLSRQVPRDRQVFGALLLLERLVKRLRRRRRVKDRVLLALRALALMLLALAVVDPAVSWPGGLPEFGGSGRVILLVDRSLSMSAVDAGSTLNQRAREEADRAIAGLPQGVLLGAVVYGDRAERLTPALTTDHQRVRERIAEIEPSSETSDLRGALLEARRLLGGEPGEVILLSDEAGPRVVAEAKGEIARLIEARGAIYPIDIAPDAPRNVAVESAQWAEGLDGGRVVVRLRNYGDSPIEIPCEVRLPDDRTIPVFVDIPPNGPAEETVTLPADAQGGIAEVRCEDPDLPADDARFFHLPQAGATRVLVVDGDPGETPTRSEVYFLERALAPWGGTHGDVAIDLTTPLGLMDLDPERHRVVFLANVADPRPFGPKLTQFVRDGGSLVISAGDNVTAAWYNGALAPVLPAGFRKPRSLASGAPGDEGAALQLPATDEPLFAPFARSGRGGFARVRAHTVLTLEPFAGTDEIRTLLTWEGGMPALVEREVGPGRVVIWTSTFDMGWTNLPLQAVFMPFVQRLVDVMGAQSGASAARIDALVGEVVTVPLPDGVLDAEVTGPDGSPVRARVDSDSLVFTATRPGAYSVGPPDAPPLARVAVNTVPEESDVRRYDSVATVESELDPGILRQSRELGPHLLAAAAVVGLLAALLAVRGSRSAAEPALEAL